MAKTTAQRQAEYRVRRPTAGDNGERRLSLWVSTASKLALDRLARRYRVTKQEVLERLLQIEDDRVSASIELESPEWDEYYGTTNVTR
ncbi:MAG: hypothetical protein V4724_20970 [Pseudomonadota bacterium]